MSHCLYTYNHSKKLLHASLQEILRTNFQLCSFQIHDLRHCFKFCLLGGFIFDSVSHINPKQGCNATPVLFWVMPAYYAEHSVNKIQFLFPHTTVHSEYLRRSQMCSVIKTSILQEKQPYELESLAHATFMCLQEGSSQIFYISQPLSDRVMFCIPNFFAPMYQVTLNS